MSSSQPCALPTTQFQTTLNNNKRSVKFILGGEGKIERDGTRHLARAESIVPKAPIPMSIIILCPSSAELASSVDEPLGFTVPSHPLFVVGFTDSIIEIQPRDHCADEADVAFVIRIGFSRTQNLRPLWPQRPCRPRRSTHCRCRRTGDTVPR